MQHQRHHPNRSSRRRAVGAFAALACAAAVWPSTPVNASSDRIEVREGESIQAAIDAAEPGSTIVIVGDHVENLWIDRDEITLTGAGNASLTMPSERTPNPCNTDQEDDVSALVCISPDAEGVSANEQRLADVSVSRLTLNNPEGNALQAEFTTDLRVRRITASDPGCAGISVSFADGVGIERNTVSASASCNGIIVVGSTDGRVARNTSSDNALAGITVQDSSNFGVVRNDVTGNCLGMTISDFPDGGFGIFDADLPSQNIDVSRNTANANNKPCSPLGAPFGGTGIAVGGGRDITISRNTTNDNVIDFGSATAAGIFVFDFPNGGPVVEGLTVTRNQALGNSSSAGDVDLRILAAGIDDVSRNDCGVSSPDETWCNPTMPNADS